jgi:hypothetical protein
VKLIVIQVAVHTLTLFPSEPTPRGRALLEKMTVTQLLEKFSALYEKLDIHYSVYKSPHFIKVYLKIALPSSSDLFPADLLTHWTDVC